MNHVISAFIDNEPFDPVELRDALASAEGREELLDLIALRHVVQPPVATVPVAPPRVRSITRWSLAAAAAVVLVGAGYTLGLSSVGETVITTAQVSAPEPTAVLKFEDWDDRLPTGGN